MLDGTLFANLDIDVKDKFKADKFKVDNQKIVEDVIETFLTEEVFNPKLKDQTTKSIIAKAVFKTVVNGDIDLSGTFATFNLAIY